MTVTERKTSSQLLIQELRKLSCKKHGFTSKYSKYHKYLSLACQAEVLVWREVGSVLCSEKKLTFTLQSCPFESVLQHVSSVVPTPRSSVRGRTHRWCSAPPSSPGGSRTCPPGRPRGRCSVGDSPSARTLVPSSFPRTDTHRWCTSRGDHSPPRTPLSWKKKATKTCCFCAVRGEALFLLHWCHFGFCVDVCASAEKCPGGCCKVPSPSVKVEPTSSTAKFIHTAP